MSWRVNLILITAFGALMFFMGAVVSSWWIDNQREYIQLLPANERPPAKDDFNLPVKYINLVIHWTDQTGMPIWLMSRLWDTESWWNPHATSNKGAQGLSQIMKENIPLFSHLYFDDKPFDPYNPEDAIRAGTQYLRDLIKFTGDWGRGIAAYNAGPYTPPAKWKLETVLYVKQIWEKP